MTTCSPTLPSDNSQFSYQLEALRYEERVLVDNVKSNDKLGEIVKNKLSSLGLTAQESEKINLHFDEIEKVTLLLLSISARLQLINTQINEKSHQQRGSPIECQSNDKHFEMTSLKTQKPNDLQLIGGDKQNALLSNSNLCDQLSALVSKQQKLLVQLEEALQLRVSIDHRSQTIEEKIIRKYFKDCDNFNEFLEFTKLKSKLIIDLRQVRDKIQLTEKQLKS
ncbi:uncharacterized protein LOC128952688 [Oppia nitens]|uniref:uncharacterized protein LOC128952688 n=1 Tax=Oppia nitens TaxID=1686743 RepID=UPI0023D9A1A9|nr:uncharacterized protein LOC128952688 [Oppia nitens]